LVHSINMFVDNICKLNNKSLSWCIWFTAQICSRLGLRRFVWGKGCTLSITVSLNLSATFPISKKTLSDFQLQRGFHSFCWGFQSVELIPKVLMAKILTGSTERRWWKDQKYLICRCREMFRFLFVIVAIHFWTVHVYIVDEID
jgi:hypothetical protein